MGIGTKYLRTDNKLSKEYTLIKFQEDQQTNWITVQHEDEKSITYGAAMFKKLYKKVVT